MIGLQSGGRTLDRNDAVHGDLNMMELKGRKKETFPFKVWSGALFRMTMRDRDDRDRQRDRALL